MNKTRPFLSPKAIPLYCLLLGISATISVNGFLESQFENEILGNVAHKIDERTQGMNEEDKIETALNLCHYLQIRRSEILGGQDYSSFKANHLYSSLQSFYIGTGACGYYSLFAARVFQKLGYTPKIVQQRINNQWGAHITLIIPLKSSGKWVLLDPLLKHSFRDASNHLSSIQTVQANWNRYYAQRIPPNYKPEYNYQEGWRHTNWDKFGPFSRMAHKILTFFIGREKTESICFRMYLIDPYKIQGVLGLLFSMAFLGLLMAAFQKSTFTKQ